MYETAKPSLRKKREVKAKACHQQHQHADHEESLPRLKRIQGQVQGIEKMITERRYCVDILVQIKAARSALQSLENEVLGTHLEGCVRDALTSRNSFQAGKKIKELMELLAR